MINQNLRRLSKMSEVAKMITEIKTNLSQASSSQKDELKVMQTMLNDTSYEVGIYGKNGLEKTYNPSMDARHMCAGIIASAAKISQSEAEGLMANYEFKKSDANTMINISKEFVNTFIQTGRKLPLGAREKSNVSISLKEVEGTTRSYPKKVGVNADGTPRYEKAATTVPAHQSIKVHAPCPVWVK